jgi:hypothetical protein
MVSGIQVPSANQDTEGKLLILSNETLALSSTAKSGSGWIWCSIRRERDERLPKGPRFASESLDADTVSGPVFQTDPLPKERKGRNELFWKSRALRCLRTWR